MANRIVLFIGSYLGLVRRLNVYRRAGLARTVYLSMTAVMSEAGVCCGWLDNNRRALLPDTVMQRGMCVAQ